MCERRKANDIGRKGAKPQKDGKQEYYSRRPPHEPPKGNDKGDKNK